MCVIFLIDKTEALELLGTLYTGVALLGEVTRAVMKQTKDTKEQSKEGANESNHSGKPILPGTTEYHSKEFVFTISTVEDGDAYGGNQLNKRAKRRKRKSNANSTRDDDREKDSHPQNDAKNNGRADDAREKEKEKEIEKEPVLRDVYTMDDETFAQQGTPNKAGFSPYTMFMAGKLMPLVSCGNNLDLLRSPPSAATRERTGRRIE
mgnify:CR=1 FL=1